MKDLHVTEEVSAPEKITSCSSKQYHFSESFLSFGSVSSRQKLLQIRTDTTVSNSKKNFRESWRMSPLQCYGFFISINSILLDIYASNLILQKVRLPA
jgi:hypothetical protein